MFFFGQGQVEMGWKESAVERWVVVDTHSSTVASYVCRPSCVVVVVQEIFSELDEIKAEVPILSK
jgi:hypothetical protein